MAPRTLWRMPSGAPPTIYLTFDDGPNPAATPALLDVLARHGVKATFFIIDRHLTAETAPIVRRAFEEGHAVALHSHTRAMMFYRPALVASTLQEAAAHTEVMTGLPDGGCAAGSSWPKSRSPSSSSSAPAC